MRQVFLDTETTGLEHKQGHRVIEVAGVEVINRRVTNRHYHQYINPEREIDAGAQEVHGLSADFLQDKPVFADIAKELIEFIADSELIMHNAPFDVGFLNSEFARLSLPTLEEVVFKVTDTLQMAKEMRPGQRNNLDALCKVYGIDNSHRTLHGALLDSELLAEVYISMTRGQESLVMDLDVEESTQHDDHDQVVAPLFVHKASIEELNAHMTYIEALEQSGGCLWKK